MRYPLMMRCWGVMLLPTHGAQHDSALPASYSLLYVQRQSARARARDAQHAVARACAHARNDDWWERVHWRGVSATRARPLFRGRARQEAVVRLCKSAKNMQQQWKWKIEKTCIYNTFRENSLSICSYVRKRKEMERKDREIDIVKKNVQKCTQRKKCTEKKKAQKHHIWKCLCTWWWRENPKNSHRKITMRERDGSHRIMPCQWEI